MRLTEYLLIALLILLAGWFATGWISTAIEDSAKQTVNNIQNIRSK